MKILEINKFYFRKGGGDKHFFDVIELLRSNGHEVAVFSMHHPENEPSPWDKYFVSTVGYTGEYSFWQKIKGIVRMFYSFEAQRKINQLLDDFQPDVVHIHNIYHQLSPCILFAIKQRGIPIVMTVHDFKLISPNYNLTLDGKPYLRCQQGKYYQCVVDRCVKHSYAKSALAALEMYWHAWLGTYRKNIDRYIAPSEFVKKILNEWGIMPAKIAVLAHFVPTPPQSAITGAAPVQEQYALYFGRISKEKGIDQLVELFRSGATKLYLAGALENEYQIPNAPNVRHLGYLNQDALRKYIRSATVIVSGSSLPETFGLVALESIVNGKPFIGFRAGAYPEIIENQKNGFLVDTWSEFGLAVHRIFGGETQFDQNQIQKDALEKFSPPRYYQQIMSLFERTAIDK